jgi:hypothetical protein
MAIITKGLGLEESPPIVRESQFRLQRMKKAVGAEPH